MFNAIALDNSGKTVSVTMNRQMLSITVNGSKMMQTGVTRSALIYSNDSDTFTVPMTRKPEGQNAAQRIIASALLKGGIAQ